MRDPRFHDDVRLDLVNHFLQADHVVRKLDDRSAQPGKAVYVLCIPANAQPGPSDLTKRFRRCKRNPSNQSVRPFDFDNRFFEINLHAASLWRSARYRVWKSVTRDLSVVSSGLGWKFRSCRSREMSRMGNVVV